MYPVGVMWRLPAGRMLPYMARPNVHAIVARKIVVGLARAIGYVTYFYLIAVEVILFLGFFLLLFGANPSAGFTQWVYRNLDRVMAPFRGIFTPIQLGTTAGNVESVFETSVLFAMIIYGILAIAISALTSWLSSRMRYLQAAEAEADRLEEQERLAAEAVLPSQPPAPAAAAVTHPPVTEPSVLPAPPPPGQT